MRACIFAISILFLASTAQSEPTTTVLIVDPAGQKFSDEKLEAIGVLTSECMAHVIATVPGFSAFAKTDERQLPHGMRFARDACLMGAIDVVSSSTSK